MVQGLVATLAYFLILRQVIVWHGAAAAGGWSMVVGLCALLRVGDVFGGAGLARLLARAPTTAGRRGHLLDTVLAASLGYYALVGVLALPALQFHAAMPDRALVPLALLLLLANAASTALLASLDGIGRADLRARIATAGAAGSCLAALLLIPGSGLHGLAAALIVQAVAQALAARWALRRALPGLGWLPRRLSMAALREASRFGLGLQASFLPLLIYEPLSRVLVGRLVGLEALAVFDLAYKLASYMRMLLQSATTPLLPEFARLGAAARGLYRRAGRLTLWLSLGQWLLTLAAAPLVSLLTLGAVLPGFVISAAVFATAFAVASAGLVPSQFAQSQGRLGWNIAGQWTIAAAIPVMGLTLWWGLAPVSALVPAMAVAVASGYGLALAGNRRMARAVLA